MYYIHSVFDLIRQNWTNTKIKQKYNSINFFVNNFHCTKVIFKVIFNFNLILNFVYHHKYKDKNSQYKNIFKTKNIYNFSNHFLFNLNKLKFEKNIYVLITITPKVINSNKLTPLGIIFFPFSSQYI